MSSSAYLIDTSVLVDYLRGESRAADYLRRLKGELCVSVVTVAELYAGSNTQAEQDIMEDFLMAFKILNFDLEIAKIAGLIKKDYAKKYGTGFADALIAATAYVHEAVIVTLDKKHYQMFKNVEIPY